MSALSRRSFLRGIIAVTGAAIVAPTVKFLRPSIWGDGIHDDAAGLNALFNGQPVDILNESIRVLDDGRIFLSSGTFRLGLPLVVRRPDIAISDCTFSGADDFEGRALLEFQRGAKRLSLTHCTIACAPKAAYGVYIDGAVEDLSIAHNVLFAGNETLGRWSFSPSAHSYSPSPASSSPPQTGSPERGAHHRARDAENRPTSRACP